AVAWFGWRIAAQCILDMRLKALQGLEREKLTAEYEELEKKIAYFHDVLGDINLVKGILKDELIAIRDEIWRRRADRDPKRGR
ncbi:MAG: hypothetical protein V8S89_02325, partial [Oscillospiraceae bacterium]